MPSDPNRIDHALTLAADGKPDQADTLLEHLARQDNDATAAWHLAWLRLRAGNAEGALAALCAFPEDPVCSERAREMLVGERRNQQALALLKHAPRRPGDPRSLVSDAVERHLAGDYAGAISACRQALALAPAHAPAHNHLARALHNLGQFRAAQAEFERAVHADPRYPEAWHNLAHSLRAANQLERACEALEQALAISPGYRSARLNLGITLFEQGQPVRALECFEALLARDRDDVEAMVNAGLCLQLTGKLGKARQRMERALELVPGHQWAHYYLGAILREQGDTVGARASLDKALALRPSDADAWAQLHALHADNGDDAAAEAALSAGLTFAPGHPDLNIEAARRERLRGDGLGAETRLRRIEPAALPTPVRERYFHELGRVLDRNSRCDAAFDAFVQGNALAAEASRWRGSQPDAIFHDLHAIDSWLDAGAPGLDGVDDGDGDQGADLCFVVGFPRSEHPQFEQVMAAHPGVSLLRERNTLETMVTTLKGLPGGYPSSIARLDRSDRLALRRMYRLALAREGAQAGRLVLDQSPLRLVHAGLVQALFPKARLLLSLRHPCDAVLDNFMHAAPGDDAANFHTLAGAVRLYDATLALWHKLQPRLSLAVAELRREEVATAPRTALAETCRFLGIDWDPALLEASTADAPANATLRNPAFAARRTVPHWERYRTPLQPFLRTLGEHAQLLGYDMAHPRD
ncbi:MAG: tetratricopeptide repeat protein [Arenimonas sp.]|nr:tetratricopeptide repeat protein [Arenimonas sp.]